MDQGDADRQNDRAYNPDPDLQWGQTATVDRRVQMVIDAKKEERHPAQQIMVGMGWQRWVILGDPHRDTPDHACDDHHYGRAEAQYGSRHFNSPDVPESSG